MEPNLEYFSLHSDTNVLKRDPSSGHQTLTLPGPGGSSSVLKPVSHNLGYVPNYVTGYRIGTGPIWSNNYEVERMITLSAGGTEHPVMENSCSTTQLKLGIYDYSGSYSGNVTLYWVIYKDYKNQ